MNGDESSGARDPIEALAAEFMARCRSGERPSVDEYARRHPEMAEEIRELFPTILALEEAKQPGSSGDAMQGTVGIDRVGDFRIIRELGRGGMGIVYEAEQESLGRRVAVKVLPRQMLLGRRQLERFEREARTAAGLHHTNIVPVFGVGDDGGHHYIVMQYIRSVGLDVVLRELGRMVDRDRATPGSTTDNRPDESRAPLSDAISVASALIEQSSAWADAAPSAPRGSHDEATVTAIRTSDSTEAVPAVDTDARTSVAAPVVTASRIRLKAGYWRSVARIGRQVAEALDYAHRHGTLHRDVKPGNVLIDADGSAWVADFGLAKAIDQEGVTRTGDVVGTLRYMAPEQLQGRTDARSDVYSLGLTLYEMAALRPAFTETSKTSVLGAIMRGGPPALRRVRPDMPHDLETVIEKCMAREPEMRYASAGEVAEDLARFLDDRPILARRTTAVERLWRWARRNPSLAALTTTTALLLLLVAGTSTAAYVHTRLANQKVREALAGEQRQRQKTEATSELALEALDTIFAELAPRRTLSLSASYSDDESTDAVTVPIQPVLSKETATLLEHMLDFYNRLAEQESDRGPIQRKIADATRRVGDIHQRLGAFDAAEQAYRRALELYAELEETADDRADLELEIARIHNELGSNYVTQEQVPEGRAEFARAVATLEPLTAPKDASAAVRFELARAHYLLGRSPRPPLPPPRREGRRPPPGFPPPGRRRPGPGAAPPARLLANDGSEAELQQAVTILEALGAEHPRNPSYQHLLALCYRELRPGSAVKESEAERDPVTRAVAILEELVREYPGVPEYRFDLSDTYFSMDERRGPDEVDLQEARQSVRKAIAIMEALVAERPNVPDYVLSLAHMHHKLGDLLRRSGEPAEADAAFARAVTLQESLVERFPNVGPYAVGLALFRLSLAERLLVRDELQQAHDQLMAGIGELESEKCTALGQPYVTDLTARSYLLLSHALMRMGEDEAANGARRHSEVLHQSVHGEGGEARPQPP